MRTYKIFVGSHIYLYETDKQFPTHNSIDEIWIKNCYKYLYSKDDPREYIDLFIYGNFHVEVYKEQK